MSVSKLNENDNPLRNSIGKAIFWVAIEKWGSRLFSLAVFAILTRLIAVEDFGLVSMASVTLAFVTVFVDSGFSKALIQRKFLGSGDASTAFWTSLALSILLAFGLVAAAPLVAAGFGDEGLLPVLYALSFALPLAALSGVPAAILERDLEFRALSLRTFLGALVGALVAVPLAVWGAGVWALVAQTLTALLASVITLWAATPWRPTWAFSVSSLRDMWKFASGFLGIELLNTFQMNIDKLLIGTFLGPSALGYYFVGQRAVIILTELVSSILSRVSLATFSKLQSDPKRTIRVLTGFVFVSGAIATPVFGIMALLATEVIPFLFGSGWVLSVLVFQLLAPSAALNSISSIDKNVMLATGHIRSAVVIGVLQMLVGTALIFAALPFGIVGVAASRTILAAVLIPLRAALLRSTVGMLIGPYFGRILICGVALLPSAILILILRGTEWAAVAQQFWSFAVPVSAIAFLLYGGTLVLICGRTYRRLIFSAGRSVLRPA